METDKPVSARNVPTHTPPTLSRGQLTHEQIAARAEQLWSSRNRPSGHDDQIWLEAEAQLKAEAEAKPVAGTAARPQQDRPAAAARSGTKSSDPAEALAQPRVGTERKAPLVRNRR